MNDRTSDLMSERMITLEVVASENDTDVSAIRRWVKRGLKGPDGERVRLEAVRLGGKWKTSREALRRFAARLTPNCGPAHPAALPRTQTQRETAARKADRKLERIGL